MTPAPDNSLLVTFDLEPSETGTLLRFRETGFADQGWEPAVVEETSVITRAAGITSCPAWSATSAG